MSIHDAFIRIYQDDPKREVNFYIITDPDRWLKDEHVQRRVLNVAHQLHNNQQVVKVVIFVGTRLRVPEKLQKYIQVVHDHGLTDEELQAHVAQVCGYIHRPVPADAAKMFRGLTTYEVNQAISRSIIVTRKDSHNPKRIDGDVVAAYKREQLRKTDLLQYVDTSAFTFDVVGGVSRFKEWCRKTRATWSEKGQAFGLKPPKGVLAVGVWGCGKSLSVKAMGAAWGLPVVQLEMGKLRSSGVGESEANVYRACRLIEAVSPCIVWIDEAEKSLSGNASSGASDAGTTSRTIGILSTWLQETQAPVCVAMTANSLKTMPIEFINRMDERFFFDLPSEDERIEILKIHLRKAGQDPDDFNLADLTEKAKTMVGREIEQSIAAAMVESFDQGKPDLDGEILAEVLETKPRIFRTMVDELREILDWVGYDPDVDEGIRARFASDQRSETFKKLGTV
jgi:SpoVK/Ycf46/Vps4 family AAA+-type ATPase